MDDGLIDELSWMWDHPECWVILDVRLPSMLDHPGFWGILGVGSPWIILDVGSPWMWGHSRCWIILDAGSPWLCCHPGCGVTLVQCHTGCGVTTVVVSSRCSVTLVAVSPQLWGHPGAVSPWLCCHPGCVVTLAAGSPSSQPLTQALFHPSPQGQPLAFPAVALWVTVALAVCVVALLGVLAFVCHQKIRESCREDEERTGNSREMLGRAGWGLLAPGGTLGEWHGDTCPRELPWPRGALPTWLFPAHLCLFPQPGHLRCL